MGNPAVLQAKLKVLRDNYAAQLPDKLKLLELTWSKLPRTGRNEEGLRTLHRMVHGLAGSGKTFGFSALGEAAHEIEKYLNTIAQEHQPLGAKEREHIESLLSGLNHLATLQDDAPISKAELLSVPLTTPVVQISRHVFVVENEVDLARELQTQLSYFGYEVSVFNTLGEFRSAFHSDTNAVVLMDVNFPEDSWGGIKTIAEIQQGREVPVPVVFLSGYDELQVRLESVRAGGIAYLTKPVNMGILVDKLDELTSIQTPAAYRVMIVDDAVPLTVYYAAVLEQVDILVKVVNDPLKLLKPLLEFAPDLILIDVYMPGCSGLELAKTIRQIDAFISIPIVFLSSEKNIEKQLIAIGMGGDDFLTKPIKPQHLVAAVKSRIQRSQILRSFMVRDSLTGLLNHTAIKAQLSHELARAKRQDKPLSFAMVDIDHFKSINDNYGHAVGDRVIKSLARLLKQRLRENDLVGRYGGEEFAVVLADADVAVAYKIMDDIRNDFARLSHLADEQPFTVTFSCGIADTASYSEAPMLVDAADKALYKAKHAGRNQVVL